MGFGLVGLSMLIDSDDCQHCLVVITRVLQLLREPPAQYDILNGADGDPQLEAMSPGEPIPYSVAGQPRPARSQATHFGIRPQVCWWCRQSLPCSAESFGGLGSLKGNFDPSAIGIG